MSEKPPNRHSYWIQVFIKSCEDFGMADIISEITGGIVISFFACKWGIANRAELWELIFLCIGAAILSPLVGFLIRLFFITPAKLYRKLEDEAEINESKCRSRIEEKESTIKKLEGEIESMQAPRLEIEPISCDMKTTQWHLLQINVHNKSNTLTADNVRVELLALEDELKTEQQIAYFHPVFPYALQTATPCTNSINPDSILKFNIFRVSPNVKTAVMKDGIVMTFRQKVTAHFSTGTIRPISENSTALFDSGKRYRLKLAATARDFPKSEREFDLIIYEKGSFCQITLEYPQ